MRNFTSLSAGFLFALSAPSLPAAWLPADALRFRQMTLFPHQPDSLLSQHQPQVAAGDYMGVRRCTCFDGVCGLFPEKPIKKSTKRKATICHIQNISPLLMELLTHHMKWACLKSEQTQRDTQHNDINFTFLAAYGCLVQKWEGQNINQWCKVLIMGCNTVI